MKTLISSAALIAATTLTATGQLQVDRSVLLTGTQRLYEVDRLRDRVTPLTSPSSGTEYSAVCMDRGNLNALIVDRVEKRVIAYNAAGRIITFKRLSSTTNVNGIALDQDGHIVMCDSIARSLIRTSGASYSGPLTTIKTLSMAPQAICVDDDTGDYIVGATRVRPTGGSLFRVDRRTLSVSTIATGLGSITGVDHDQTTGNFVVVTRSTPQIRVLSANGSVLATKSFTNANAVRIDDETGTIWVASTTQVQRLSSDLRISKLYPAISGDIIHGIQLWGSQKLAGNPSTQPLRGSEFEVQGRFTASANQPYACALSAGGLRPGFRVAGGRTINVALDPLFFVTVAGGLPVYTSDFAGTTNTSGGFAVRFMVPPVGVGTRFVLAAAAVNPSKPGSLDVAASYVFHVQ